MLAASTTPLWRRLVPWITIALVIAVALIAVQKITAVEKPILVDVVSVQAGDVERTVASVSAGRVAARKRARIAAPIVGRIVKLLARKGDKVAKDQVVVELDSAEAQANLAQAKSVAEGARAGIQGSDASLLMAKSQSEQAKAQIEQFDALVSMSHSSSDCSKAAIDEASTRLEIAKSEYERRRKLDKGIVAPEVVEHAAKEVTSWEAQLAGARAKAAEAESHIASATAQLREAKARATEAEARVAQIEAQLSERRAHATEAEAMVAQAQAVLEKHSIKAPFAGVLSELWVEQGEVTNVAPSLMAGAKGSDPSGSKLFEILDLDDLYVTAPIDEVDLARVKVGQESRVTLDPWPKEPFTGKVVRVAPFVLDVEEQNRTVEVEVAIPSEWLARGLKPGTSADVEIVVERHTGVPRLPTNVLLDGKRALSLETNAQGETRAVERELEIGIDNWRFAEIKGGLPPGAKVISGAVGDVHVKAGQRVQVRSESAVEPGSEKP